MARKILITGAEGQLGKALQISLSDKFEILSTTRKPSKVAINNRNIFKLDITDNEDVSKYITSFDPDIIINCAAYTDVDNNEENKDLAHKVNVQGLNNLIQSSGKDTYIVQISSDYVFDGTDGPYDEDDHTFPVNYYGKTKLEAENILRGTRRKWVIIRPNVLYSDDLFCKGNFFAWVYKSLLKGQNISVITDQISNPTPIYQLVTSIFQSILLTYEGILHIGSDDCVSRYEFATKIAKVFSFDTSFISPIDTKLFFKNVKSYIAERPMHSGLKVNKIERELNISTYPLEYSLKQLKASMT